MRGGTQVTIVGVGFLSIDPSAGLFRVRFGDATPMLAYNLTDATAVVQTVATSASVQSVAISLNTFDYARGQPDVLYQFYDHNISSVTPTGGPIRGGTVVTVHGISLDTFGNLETVRCDFGGRVVQSVSGTLLHNQTVCISPPHDSLTFNASALLASLGAHSESEDVDTDAGKGGGEGLALFLTVRLCCFLLPPTNFNNDATMYAAARSVVSGIFESAEGDVSVGEVAALSLSSAPPALSQLALSAQLSNTIRRGNAGDVEMAVNSSRPISLALDALHLLHTPYNLGTAVALEHELHDVLAHLYAPINAEIVQPYAGL